LSYAWYVGGTLVGETGSSLSGVTYFDKNQAVYVEVTPNDGTDDGTTVTSSSIIVSNTAPTAPVISIDPAAPEAGTDDIICLIDTASSDDDGDALTYTFDWDVDSIAWTGSTYTTYNAGDTINGADVGGEEEWTCEVTPNDGDDEGSSASDTITSKETACSEEGVYADFETDTACPVAHWDMSSLDSQSRPKELIHDNNSLDIYGTPTAGVDGAIGTTYQINNSSDYFISETSYPTALQGSSSKSISAWTQINTKDGDGDGVSAFAGFGAASNCTSGSFALSYTTEQSLDDPRFVSCGDDLLGGTSWNVNEWHHMVSTYDGTNVVLYIDGVGVSSEAKALYTDTYFDHVTVGVDPWWSSTYHYLTHGLVDEVKLYDYALAASEVEELYKLNEIPAAN
jgi:hypothetical protein